MYLYAFGNFKGKEMKVKVLHSESNIALGNPQPEEVDVYFDNEVLVKRYKTEAEALHYFETLVKKYDLTVIGNELE